MDTEYPDQEDMDLLQSMRAFNQPEAEDSQNALKNSSVFFVTVRMCASDHQTRHPSLCAQRKCWPCRFPMRNQNVLVYWRIPQNLFWTFSCIWRTPNTEVAGTTTRSDVLSGGAVWITLIWLLFNRNAQVNTLLTLALRKLTYPAQWSKGHIKKLMGRKTDNNINLIVA